MYSEMPTTSLSIPQTKTFTVKSSSLREVTSSEPVQTKRVSNITRCFPGSRVPPTVGYTYAAVNKLTV
jgi:hypothetical protein